MKKFLRLPKVYPITDTALSGLSHADQVAQFADGGATLVQLREKHTSSLLFYEAARAALAVAVKRGLTLIINDRVDVAMAVGAAGVHLGQDDLPADQARRLLGNDAIIGYSTHSVAQALEAAKLPIDYLAIGPIFQTSTKSDPSPTIGLEGLGAVRQAVGNMPLVAIGGITPGNAADVVEAGADSVAMISALLAGPASPSATLKALLESLPA